MNLPIYRLGDQIIFDNLNGFSVGRVEGIQQELESWKYLISYTLDLSNKRTMFPEEKIRGVLFTTTEKLECAGRNGAEEAISLE